MTIEKIRIMLKNKLRRPTPYKAIARLLVFFHKLPSAWLNEAFLQPKWVTQGLIKLGYFWALTQNNNF